MFNHYPYQKKYLYSQDRFSITNKSRQIGWTEIVGAKSVKRCLGGTNQLIASSSQRQANNAMSYVERYLERMKPEIKGLKVVTDSRTEKQLNNGKFIWCLPSKPETIRGFNGDVRIDEYALHKDDGKIYEALLPSIVKSSNYQIGICSTPLGQSNMFYEIMTDLAKYPDFKRGTINCYDAIEQGCTMDIETIKRNLDEESFRQEFLCEFVDEQTAYFTYDLLKSIIDDYNENSLKGKCFIGIDVGRTKDRTAIAVIQDMKLKSLEVLHKKDFQTQFDVICMTINQNDAEKVLIDKGLIGYQLAEELEDKYPQSCEGVQFSNNYKNELVTNAKKLMERKDFKMFENRDLISDFHSIKRNITPSNQVNFDSKRDEKGHADRAWAVMLGLRAATVLQPSYTIGEWV